MITRRKRIHDLIDTGQLYKSANRGLWLDKYIENATNDESGKRTAFVKQVVEISEPSEYSLYFFDVWKPSVLRASASTREAKVNNRLSVGLGTESLIETNISLHRLFGTPLIPGSAVKGLISHYLHHYASADLQIGGTDHTVIFGDHDNAGFLTFYDALYVPGSGFDKRAFHADVITTHHQDYYTGKNVPPADWDNPVPVPFISATGNYLFAIGGPDEWVKLSLQVLEFALQNEGIGAKTSSGYGRMHFVTETMPADSEARRRSAAQQNSPAGDAPSADSIGPSTKEASRQSNSDSSHERVGSASEGGSAWVVRRMRRKTESQ